jgi:hypothetical protein
VWQTQTPWRDDESKAMAWSLAMQSGRLFALSVNHRRPPGRQLAPHNGGDGPGGENTERGTGTAAVVEEGGPPQVIGKRRGWPHPLPRCLGEHDSHVVASPDKRGRHLVSRLLYAAAISRPSRVVAGKDDSHERVADTRITSRQEGWFVHSSGGDCCQRPAR